MIRVFFLAFYYALNCIFAEPFAIMVTFPIFAICCLNLYYIKEKTIDAEDMFWLTIYLFFVIGPCQSFNHGFIGSTGPVSGVSFTEGELIQASLIVITFSLFATLTKFLRTAESQKFTDSFRINSHAAAPLLVLNLIALLGFVVFSGGFANVLASRADKVRDAISPISTVFISVQIVITILIATLYRTTSNSKFPTIAFIASALLLLFAQNPFNTPRFYLIAAWLPVFLVLIRGKIGAPAFYTCVFAAIIILMPILSLTSRFGYSVSEALGNVNIQEAFFRLPYIDSFDMLAYEIKFISRTGYYWGEKCLGIALFFIPRAIWLGKPTILTLDMGVELEDAKVAGTSNLALFFPGEFYADFGLMGVACGAVLVTYGFSKIPLLRNSTVNGLRVKSFILIASIPIIIRGAIAVTGPLTLLELLTLAALLAVFATRTRRTIDGLENLSFATRARFGSITRQRDGITTNRITSN
jgi:hypothetical protein